MVFSSVLFLYYFLPVVLILYFLAPQKLRNLVLLIGSLFFYFYGEPRYILVLIFSIIFNYYIGKLIEKLTNKNIKKTVFISSIVINFGLLFYFKYFNFFIDNINNIFATNINPLNIVMPIGISFFTFQASSYVIDIYRGKVTSANSVLDFATYLSLFPQLIAGPIVRYETVAEEMKVRKTNYTNFSNGVRRFIFGLSKKVLLANVLGEFSSILFSMQTKSVLAYWLKAIVDTLQIYLDFSGYSDMAIGLGLMFGFHFLENFNYPFIASSVTEFWHRWHISLSSWFKDYIYIPLGGSRVGTFRRYLNIFIVWMVTGLWHGASWNFVLWGVYFAVFLILEKMFLYKFFNKHKVLGIIWTDLLAVISFVIFNQTTLSGIGTFISSMFGFNNLEFTNIETMYYLKNYIVILIISILFSTPLCKYLVLRMKECKIGNTIISVIEPVIYIGLLLLCTAFIVDESFNPFLYFRF